MKPKSMGDFKHGWIVRNVIKLTFSGNIIYVLDWTIIQRMF